MNSSKMIKPMPAWIRSTAGLLTLIFSLHGMVPMAAADFIPSTLIQDADMRDSDLATIQQALELKVVQHRLEELGFTGEEIQTRLALATDEEVHQLALHSESVMAGGGVVEVLLVVVLVLLILRLASIETLESDGVVV
ncbi:MAG: PA2779 family protein [Verrucomicrobia bacterium]|nr:PA2779 family protein [Verrucomicrobiota bacterium]MCH8512430.1 PA2779 family protein [Kiritimatiellia bacterium]